MNQQAIEMYILRMAEITTALAALTEWAEDMGGVSPDDIDYTHAATLAEVLANLEAAAVWAHVEVNYAAGI